MSLIKPKSYYQEYRHEQQKYIDLVVRLESLSIKWNKRGKSAGTWDEALEEMEETFK